MDLVIFQFLLSILSNDGVLRWRLVFEKKKTLGSTNNRVVTLNCYRQVLHSYTSMLWSSFQRSNSKHYTILTTTTTKSLKENDEEDKNLCETLYWYDVVAELWWLWYSVVLFSLTISSGVLEQMCSKFSLTAVSISISNIFSANLILILLFSF